MQRSPWFKLAATETDVESQSCALAHGWLDFVLVALQLRFIDRHSRFKWTFARFMWAFSHLNWKRSMAVLLGNDVLLDVLVKFDTSVSFSTSGCNRTLAETMRLIPGRTWRYCSTFTSSLRCDFRLDWSTKWSTSRERRSLCVSPFRFATLAIVRAVASWRWQGKSLSDDLKCYLDVLHQYVDQVQSTTFTLS